MARVNSSDCTGRYVVEPYRLHVTICGLFCAAVSVRICSFTLQTRVQDRAHIYPTDAQNGQIL